MEQAQAPPPPSPTAARGEKVFPPMTGDDVQRYQGLFAQLDADHDGYVLVSASPKSVPLRCAGRCLCIKPPGQQLASGGRHSQCRS